MTFTFTTCKPQRKCKNTGFTLIELLVAVGITAMLVGLMLTIVVNVMGGWSRSSGSLTAGNQARLVMDQLTRDLQSAILKSDSASNVWLAATIQPAGVIGDWGGSKPEAGSLSIPTLTATTDPVPSLDDYRFGQAGVWLRFFSTVPDTNATGHLSAPRAISYQIVREPVTAGSSEYRYLLFRSEFTSGSGNGSSADTFTAGYNLYGTAYEATTSTLRTPALSQVLANNVVDFGVRFWKHDSTGALVPLFPTSTDTLAFAATTGTSGDGKTEAAPIRDFPEVVDIFLRVLTDDGVQQLDLLKNGKITGDWWDIALANSNVYTRRIEIKSKAF